MARRRGTQRGKGGSAPPTRREEEGPGGGTTRFHPPEVSRGAKTQSKIHSAPPASKPWPFKAFVLAKPSVPLPRRFSLEGVRVPVRRPLPTAANQQGEYARQENQKENSRQEKSGPVMSFFPQRSLRPSGRGFFLKLVPPGLRVPSFTPSFRSKCPFLPAHQGSFRTTRIWDGRVARCLLSAPDLLSVSVRALGFRCAVKKPKQKYQ